MSDRDVREEVEKKDAEMLRQQELGEKDDVGDDGLYGYDKTDADSFPASDPPSAEQPETPEEIDEAASASITGVRPHDD